MDGCCSVVGDVVGDKGNIAYDDVGMEVKSRVTDYHGEIIFYGMTSAPNLSTIMYCANMIL